MAYPIALTLRVGCELTYFASQATHALLLVRPAASDHLRLGETYTQEPWQAIQEETDSHGNRVDRVTLQAGLNTIRHDALVRVSSEPEPELVAQRAVPVEQLPMSLLRYTMPSRYCDSDRLVEFARSHFDDCAPGAPTVRAISDWAHNNIEYRFGAGSKYTTASEIVAQGYGVCRDFAHATVALCRTFNIPARYAASHLPDIGVTDSGSPMDFHANAEVYLDQRWYTVDARFNCPRIGRMRIACGMDATETALSTLYGNVDLVGFWVWNYQVDPSRVSLSDPVDLSLRLDGTPELRLPENPIGYRLSES
jgi:transglutaminase-like putative cysteine protease